MHCRQIDMSGTIDALRRMPRLLEGMVALAEGGRDIDGSEVSMDRNVDDFDHFNSVSRSSKRDEDGREHLRNSRFSHACTDQLEHASRFSVSNADGLEHYNSSRFSDTKADHLQGASRFSKRNTDDMELDI